MKPYKSLLPHPDDITDEAAAVLTEVLFYLATASELRYGSKLRRHVDAKRAAEIDRLDPDRPWTGRPAPA